MNKYLGVKKCALLHEHNYFKMNKNTQHKSCQTSMYVFRFPKNGYIYKYVISL